MIYEINDRTLIEEMCGDIRNTVRAEYTALEEKNKKWNQVAWRFCISYG